MKTLKVMTFNTQHCLDYLAQKIDFEVMAEAIRREEPDIVGLNEMRGAGQNEEYAAQVDILSELTGMKYFHFAPAIEFPGGGPYGNGFLSRIPIEKAETVMIPDPVEKKYDGYYETRCILKATLEGGITVLCSHFGLNPDELENAVSTAVENLAPRKCILMGDFNMRPEDKMLLPIREKMRDTADAFAGERLSWPSDKPQVKIDYIFVSPDVRVVSADIPATVASDHRPHVATVEMD
jgi:endonuclease/exonuclease/phosphatase family metal-dependent hydrolase